MQFSTIDKGTAVNAMFKSKILKIHVLLLLAGLVCAYFYLLPTANAGTIVKWVDANGVTHYGDKLPAQEAGRNNAEMNGHGLVIKRNVQAEAKNAQQDQKNLEAQRKDNILKASYTNADEIDLARDRSLQADQATLQALSSQMESAAGRTTRNQKLADDFRKKSRPVPAYLNDELKLSQAETSHLDKQITERKLTMEATRRRFADEKARFIALKQAASTDAAGVSPEKLIAESPTATGATAAKK